MRQKRPGAVKYKVKFPYFPGENWIKNIFTGLARNLAFGHIAAARYCGP
jgi:hypothetical protein